MQSSGELVAELDFDVCWCSLEEKARLAIERARKIHVLVQLKDSIASLLDTADAPHWDQRAL